MTAVLLVLAIIITLGSAAFFAGTETGLLSVSRERILHLSREGGKKAKIVSAALSDMGRTTTILLIGNNLASVAYSSASAALATICCRDSVAHTIWSLAAAFIVLYVSEFMPKLLFAARPLRRTLAIAGVYRVVALVFAPVANVAVRLTDFFMPRKKDQKYKLTSADLVRILQDRKDGVCLSDIESVLISRIIVCRVKGMFITSDTILDALKEE